MSSTNSTAYGLPYSGPAQFLYFMLIIFCFLTQCVRIVVQDTDIAMRSLSGVCANLSGCLTMQKSHGTEKATVVSYP